MMNTANTKVRDCIQVKVKTSLCLTKYHAIKMYLMLN